MMAATTAGTTPRTQRFVAPLRGWLTAIALIAIWQAWTAIDDSLYFPTPWEIIDNARVRWFSGPSLLSEAFFQDVTPSLGRLVAGLVIAWTVGISVGVLIGRNRFVAELVEPLLHFMRAMPGPVLLPLALVLIGTGDSMRISLIAFGAVWPILFNTYSAVRRVPVGYLEAGKVARLGRTATLFRIVLPAASTGIFAGIRVSTALGIILLIASELVAATNGIGFGLTQSQRSFQFLDMWTFILALSALGYLSNLLLSAVERVVLRWHTLQLAITH